MTDFTEQRELMVRQQIARRGIRSGLVLDAMGQVPREEFLPAGQGLFAYDDGPLPIGEGQTISQPFIVAYMADALDLKGGENVLEIGTGSGYAAAVLAAIAAEVYTIERIAPLADMARQTLQRLGYANVHVRCCDGTLGWPEQSPYDGIVVSAGAPSVPESLRHQLRIGGRMIIPVGSGRSYQELVRVTRIEENEWTSEDMLAVRFVPLVGEEGWSSERESLRTWGPFA